MRDEKEKMAGCSSSADTTKCLVCEHPEGGSAHFGSTSCLACAAFFRRTVSLNIQFLCKKDHNCTIFHELRMICRACRFDKCLAAGMRRECVQKRRSNKKVPKKYQTAVSTTTIEEPFDDTADTTDDNSPMSIGKESSSPPPPPPPRQHCDAQPSTSRDETRCDSPHEFELIQMTGVDLLRHYVDELRHSMDRRRIIFSDSPLLAVMEDRGDMPFAATNPPPHSLRRQYESQRFDNLLAFDFCKSCPGFDLLDKMERAIFYRACSLAYCLLDIAWITTQAYLTDDDNPVVMFTDGSVCTVRDMSRGWDDEPDIGANEKKKLFFAFLARFHEAVCRPIRTLNLTDVEFAALKALCIWKLGYCEYTNRMKVLGKEHERALLVGLQTYYEDFIEDRLEMCQRLGNIILLMGTIFEMNQLIMETYKSAELFELFKLDTLSKLLLSL